MNLKEGTRRLALIMLASSLLPLSEQLLGQKQTAQKIIFHVTAVRSGDAGGDWCTNGDCIATRFTVEGYSDIKGDSHLTAYVLECVQPIPIKRSPDSVLVECPRLHPNNDYESILKSGPTNESMCFGAGLCYTIVSEKEVIKQDRGDNPCVSNRPQAHPTRPK